MGADTVTDDSYQQAQAYFNAGNFRRCNEVVRQSLASNPDDVRLLRLAGKCSLELNLGDASEYLQRVVGQSPGDVDAWRDLADSLVDEGNTREAVAALKEAIRLRPNDAALLLDLGHMTFILGRTDEALSYLSQAAQQSPGNLSILRSLVDMYRRAGRRQEALDTAVQIVDLRPEDVVATIDVAELNQELGNLNDALRAYHRLREIDTEQDPNVDHEVYAYHGMIQVEMQRENWRRVLDLAIDATRVDRLGLTTNVLAFAVSQVFGASDRPAPSRAEVEAEIAAELAEHHRRHTEALTFS